MKNKMIFLKQIFDIFFSIVFAIIILVVTSLIIQKYILKEEVPNIFGYKILQVMSGSMSGEFETGDTILIKEIKEESDLKIGDVITYRIAKNTLVTHRIVNITKIGENLNYTLKGDANNDGKLDVRDAAYIARLLANGKGKGIPPIADFNGDGTVNVRDAAAIARFLAKKH